MSKVILATASYDHTINFWEAHNGILLRSIAYSDSYIINCLELTPDMRHIAAAGNPLITLFEVAGKSSDPVTTYDGHKGNVTAIGFQKDGTWMYSGSEDGTLKIWDVRAGSGFQKDYSADAPINTVILHPNQVEVIFGDQKGNVRVWDLRNNKESKQIAPHGEVPIRTLTMTETGSTLVAGNNDGHFFAWKLASKDTSEMKWFNEAEKLKPAHDKYLLKALFSPDSKKLATTSADHTVKIWDVTDDFALSKVLTGHKAWVWDCAFSADSSFLVTGSSDNVARLWDIKLAETLLHYSGHTKPISCVALHDRPVYAS